MLKISHKGRLLGVETSKEFNGKQPQDVTLEELSSWLEEKTQSQNIRLLHSGVLMKDPKRRLGEYGLADGSKIMMLASSVDGNSAPGGVKINDPQDLQITMIQVHLAKAKGITEKPPSNAKECIQQSELLLQILLKIDGISCRDDWDRARKARKEAVIEIQNTINELDKLKATSFS